MEKGPLPGHLHVPSASSLQGYFSGVCLPLSESVLGACRGDLPVLLMKPPSCREEQAQGHTR